MVYVDDMQARRGRFTLCHMLADSDAELNAMAARLGIDRRWHQYPGSPKSHYDISLEDRARAIAMGAQPVGRRKVALLLKSRRQKVIGNRSASNMMSGE